MKKKFSLKDLKIYREKLLNLKNDILMQIKDISENTLMKSQKDLSGDISNYSLHIADVASDNYERDFNLGIVSDDRSLLLEIEEALKRIEDKTFGICKMCSKLISKSRLNVVPYTKYCKKCQEKLETKKE
ncbi:MAG: TraR/DksA C4-type zinc finger protein [Candidatus Omnitrophica bacterium]|nr:TraR/DksA C4-type zinc finger protein [Candidatus Omnitrophota bacterium]MCM8831001.1 TraR/DksA C4-type zinc finger protein [Candidatus Omnitrophota bacterium]